MKKISLEKHFLSLFRDSAIYGLGNIILRVFALATTPIITRIFAPAEYGIISLIVSTTSFLGLIMIFGMDSATALSFYEYKRERKLVVSSGFWFLLFWSMVVITLATIFSGPITDFFLKSRIYTNLLIIGFVTSIFTLLTNYAQTVLRLEFKAKTFAIIAVVNAVLATGLIILFIVSFHLGLKGYFLGSLLGTFLGFVLAITLIRENILFKISKKRLFEMIVYGSMLVPASISTYIFDLSDRFFVSHYWNLQELGLYSMAFNLTAMISFFAVAIGRAWAPFITKIYFDRKSIYKHFVSRSFAYYLIFFSIMAVLVCTFSLEVLRIFTTEKFFGATRAIPPLAIAAIFSATIQITTLGISILRKTKYLAYYTIITAVLNTFFNFLLIPKYGMVGAGWSTAISYLFLTGAYFVTSQKLIYFSVDWPKIIKLTILTGLAIFIFPLSWHFSFWINLIIKITEVGLYLILLYLSGVIQKSELRYIYLKLAKIRLRKKDQVIEKYESGSGF